MTRPAPVPPAGAAAPTHASVAETGLPTRTAIFIHAADALDDARNRLSDTSAWLRSDWTPIGIPLPPSAADARRDVLRAVAELKADIDAAAELLRQAARDCPHPSGNELRERR